MQRQERPAHTYAPYNAHLHIGSPYPVESVRHKLTPRSHDIDHLGRTLFSAQCNPHAHPSDGHSMAGLVAQEMARQKDEVQRRLGRMLEAPEADAFVFRNSRLKQAIEKVDPSSHFGEEGCSFRAYAPFVGWTGTGLQSDTLSAVTPPYVAGVMLNLLRLEPESLVQVVGSGFGYATRLAVCTLGPEGQVHAIEVDPLRKNEMERIMVRTENYDRAMGAGQWLAECADYAYLSCAQVERQVFFAALPYLPRMAVEALDSSNGGIIVYPQYTQGPGKSEYPRHLARLMVFERLADETGQLQEQLYATDFYRPFTRLMPQRDISEAGQFDDEQRQ